MPSWWAVLILWGLAVAGSAGVQHVLEILQSEFDLAMALSGCASLQDIDRSLCCKGDHPSYSSQ